MKTKLYLPITAFWQCLYLHLFLVTIRIAIHQTGDELSEPEEGQELKIGDEHGVHFEMDLSDDVMLKSYMIEIHSNFDHHSHGKSRAAATGEATVDFSFNRSYDISGKKTAHIHHHDIVIPANATPGDYHLMVYCTDAAGNETYIARNIVLSTTAERDDHHHDE